MADYYQCEETETTSQDKPISNITTNGYVVFIIFIILIFLIVKNCDKFKLSFTTLNKYSTFLWIFIIIILISLIIYAIISVNVPNVPKVQIQYA